MIIEVRRDNDKVEILVHTSLANTCDGSKTANIPFAWSTGMVYTADLLARYIRKRIEEAVSKMQQEYYEQGWKDAKSKRPKCGYFPGTL